MSDTASHHMQQAQERPVDANEKRLASGFYRVTAEHAEQLKAECDEIDDSVHMFLFGVKRRPGFIGALRGWMARNP